MIIEKMVWIYAAYIHGLLLLPIRHETMLKIKQVEKTIRLENPEIYYTRSFKKINIMRKTNYLLYPLAALFTQCTYKV